MLMENGSASGLSFQISNLLLCYCAFGMIFIVMFISLLLLFSWGFGCCWFSLSTCPSGGSSRVH